MLDRTIPAESENSRVINATILFYAKQARKQNELRAGLKVAASSEPGGGAHARAHAQSHGRGGGGLLGRGKGRSGVRLAAKWRIMTPAQRFRALGLSRAHLALLEPEQLASLAFALRARSHEAARKDIQSLHDPSPL